MSNESSLTKAQEHSIILANSNDRPRARKHISKIVWRVYQQTFSNQEVMMKTYTRSLKILSLGFAVLFSLFLMSCGSDSGSSSSSIKYSGIENQATIDDTNAEDLSRGAYENGEFGSTLSEMSPAAMATALPGSPPISPRLLAFVQTLETIVNEIVLPVESSAPSYKAVQSGKFEIDGSCGGNMSAEASVDDTAGTYSAKIKLDHFCNGGVTLHGKMSMEGSFDPEGDTFFSLFFSFNLTFQSSEESFALNGDLDIDYEDDLAAMVMNVLLEDASGKTFRIDNYTWTVIDYGTYSTVDISGRFYHPDHGYVDIVTTEVFVINQGQDSASSGVLVVTGKDNTKARLTVLSTNSFLVEMDIGDGNGYVPVT
jgi:hypothetical protein